MKKGFTLIELLGVIIILALLVVLVFPSIVNSVRDSSKKTDDLTLELIYNASNLYIDNHKNNFPKTNGNKYSIKLQDLVDEGLLISPIKLSESNSDLTSQKCVQVSYNEGFDYELKNAGSCKHIYSNGQTIYFNINEGKTCTDYKPDNSKTGYNGLVNKDEQGNITDRLDTQTSCLKFYAFLDDGSEKINLLLDHNTTATGAWTTSEITVNTTGPIDVIEQLYEDTKGWNETTPLSEYTYNHSTISYTIKYNETPEYEGAITPYKARLITAQEIAQITGADKKIDWKEESSINWYYFYDYSQDYITGRGDVCKTDGCEYGWLYDRTSTSCKDYGCLNNSDISTNGYWTSTVPASYFSTAWYVGSDGHVGSNSVNYSIGYGVRPVITVLKSDLLRVMK